MMKEYFLNLLKTLDKLTGMKQYEKLCQAANPKEEIKTLLEILCRVTDQYPYIPDEAKQQAISDAVISDPEFIGLNAKFIAKSLNLKKEFYFGKENDVVIHPEALTGEERDRRLKEWQEVVSRVEVNLTDKMDVYKTVREQWQKKENEPDYLPVDEAYYRQHELHLEYIKANYDPRTGQKKMGWMEEKQWIELYQTQP